MIFVSCIVFLFCLYRWLDSGEDDGLIERELEPTSEVTNEPDDEEG